MKLSLVSMRNVVALLVVLCCIGTIGAQELNCSVQVNYQQVNQTNRQIFQTLQRSLNEFVNQTRWTDKTVGNNERINCSMVITVSKL